jgi:hypothetical protein
MHSLPTLNLFNLCGFGIYVGKEKVFMGEIEALDHYRPLEGKTEGTMSTPYYSTKKKPSVTYFITTIQIINENHTKGQGKR